MGPPRRPGHPRVHRPGHRRAAARPRRPVGPHHRLPGPARHGRAGLAHRHPPPARPHRLGPGPGRRRPGHPRRPAHPCPAPPDPYPRRLPGRSSAPSSATQDDPGCLPHLRGSPRPVPADRRPHMRKPSWRSPSATPTWTCPGCVTSDQAEHWYRHSLGLRAEQRPARPGRVPRATWRRRLSSGSWKPAPPAKPSRCSWDTSTTPCSGYQQALDLIPADDAEHLAAVHNQLGLIYSAGRGHPAGPAPLPAIHRAPGSPGQHLRRRADPLQHRRPPAGAPAGPATRCTTHAPPSTTSSGPAPAPPRSPPRPANSSPSSNRTAGEPRERLRLAAGRVLGQRHTERQPGPPDEQIADNCGHDAPRDLGFPRWLQRSGADSF